MHPSFHSSFSDLVTSKLSDEEAQRYAVLAQQGDELAHDKLAASHLRMVHHVAQSYCQKHHIKDEEEYENLIFRAKQGLLEGIKVYDPKRGVPFRTFIYHRMKTTMIYKKDERRKNEWSMPTKKVGLWIRRVKYAQELMNDGWEYDEARNEALLRYTRYGKSSSTRTFDSVYFIFMGGEIDSLDENVGDAGNERHEYLASQEVYSDDWRAELRSELERILRTVNFRTRYSQRALDILLNQYALCEGEPLTQKELAEKYNVTRQMINKISHSTWAAVRKHEGIIDLEDFLDAVS